MSVERRIEALERAYSGAAHGEDLAEMARRREEFKAKLERAREKAAREERAGNPVRRIALQELEDHMRERIRVRSL